jgi:hypothetical protein
VSHSAVSCGTAFVLKKVKVKELRNRIENPESGRSIALHSLVLGTRRGEWSAQRLGRFTPRKTRYSLYRRLGGPQGRSGRVRKISPLLGFDPRTVQPVGSRYTD